MTEVTNYPHEIIATFHGEAYCHHALQPAVVALRRAFAAISKKNALLVIFIRNDTIGIRYYMDGQMTDEEGEENMFEDWSYEWLEQPECSPMLRKIILGSKS
jgi:hypothetical protein